MSYFNRLIVLTLFGLVFMTFAMTANAQTVPVIAIPPTPALAAPIPFGNAGNGITTSSTWTSGVGNAAGSDVFGNSFTGQNAVQGFGGPFGFGFGPCGLGGSNFASWGPFQAGTGGNFGSQNSAASGGATSTSFGLQPVGVAFGIPIAGAGGFSFT